MCLLRQGLATPYSIPAITIPPFSCPHPPISAVPPCLPALPPTSPPSSSRLGVGYFLGSVCVSFNYYFALGVLPFLILLAMPWAAVGLSNQLGRARKENLTLRRIFRQNYNISVLSVSRWAPKLLFRECARVCERCTFGVHPYLSPLFLVAHFYAWPAYGGRVGLAHGACPSAMVRAGSGGRCSWPTQQAAHSPSSSLVLFC